MTRALNSYPTDRKFGRLTPIAIFRQTGQLGPKFLCVCDCGKVGAYLVHFLRNGHTRSCGCLHDETITRRNTTHGLARSPEHISWLGMKQRCLNPKHPNYSYYGGRGIKIYEPWLTFENFLTDMGRKSSPLLTIERINNDGNYEPGNCKWATRLEQVHNRRPNRKPI
jgi:hypothetical protein